MKNLDKRDLQKLVNLYMKERDNFLWAITIEEFYKHYVRRCGCCHELVVLEERDVELENRKLWRGDIVACCPQCCEEIDYDNQCEDE